MIEKIKGWLLAALLLIVAVFTAWWRGRSRGAEDVRGEQAAQTMDQAEKAAESVREAQQDVDKMQSGGAADHLRSDWMRK